MLILLSCEDKMSQYVTSYPGEQLSLAIPLWIGAMQPRE